MADIITDIPDIFSFVLQQQSTPEYKVYENELKLCAGHYSKKTKSFEHFKHVNNICILCQNRTAPLKTIM